MSGECLEAAFATETVSGSFGFALQILYSLTGNRGASLRMTGFEGLAELRENSLMPAWIGETFSGCFDSALEILEATRCGGALRSA